MQRRSHDFSLRERERGVNVNRVYQSILGKGEEALARGEEPGDCYAACVASILELGLADVPHFMDTGPDHGRNNRLWWFALVGFASMYGMFVQSLSLSPGEVIALRGYSILAGPGPRGHRHVVVGWDGEQVHDPHPSGDGLLSIDAAEQFFPVTVAASRLLGKEPSND